MALLKIAGFEVAPLIIPSSMSFLNPSSKKDRSIKSAQSEKRCEERYIQLSQ
jgi:hypothetical protein